MAAEVKEFCATLNQNYISDHHELVRLLKRGEGIDTLLGWSPESLLLRWMNHHLARGGFNDRIGNFGDDLKDCSVLVKVMKQIQPKQIEGIDTVMNITDRFERAAKLLDFADRINCKKFVTPGDLATGKEDVIIGLVAVLFKTCTAMRMPTEAEINELFKDVDSLRYELKECNNCNERYISSISMLNTEMDELQVYANKLSAQIKDRRDDIKERTSELHAMVGNRDKEIDGLYQSIMSLEHDCDNMRSELSDIKTSKKSAGDELTKAVTQAKQRAFELEGKIEDRKSGNSQMQDMLLGKGTNLDEMQLKYNQWESKNEEASSRIADYCVISDDIVREAAAKIGAVHLLKDMPESTDDKEMLHRNVELQQQLLEEYNALLEDKKAAYIKHKQMEKRRLDDLQRSVGEFLGEGQTDASDAIGNMKRLLGLLIEKSRQQTRQVQGLEIEKEKLEHLNAIMDEKIKVIAEQQTIGKNKRFGIGGQ